MILNINHKSLLPYCKKDANGNDPFWMRCSAFNVLDVITDDYNPITDVLELVAVKPFTLDLYELKQGRIALKQGNSYYEYEFGDNFCDYDLQPYIDRGECFFKEIVANKVAQDEIND